MILAPDAIEAREKELGRNLTLEDLGELVEDTWKGIRADDEKKRRPGRREDRRQG